MITRHNIDQTLDQGRLEGLGVNGKWYRLRRNGQTRRWKRDPSRIYIPVKWGFRQTLAITERDFAPDGTLSTNFRAAP